MSKDYDYIWYLVDVNLPEYFTLGAGYWDRVFSKKDTVSLINKNEFIEDVVSYRPATILEFLEDDAASERVAKAILDWIGTGILARKVRLVEDFRRPPSPSSIFYDSNYRETGSIHLALAAEPTILCWFCRNVRERWNRIKLKWITWVNSL